MIQTAGRCSQPDVATEAGLRSLLTSALEEEAGLLEKLREIFVTQREALAAGDPLALDDGVFAATRVMRTIDEARRRRLGLTRRIAGAELEFEELDTALTGTSFRPVRLAQEEVRRVAGALREEVAILRRILEVALSDNKRYLDVLLGEESPTPSVGPGYGEVDVHPTPAGGAGVVLDRTV